MEAKPVITVMGIKCATGLEEEFDKWYMEVHLPNILKSPACDGITHYKKLPTMEGEGPTFVTMAEFKDRQAYEKHHNSPELAAARKIIGERWTDKDYELVWRGVYEPIKSWHK